jgi:pimeloyl-ACP methyl ester carboxylesterase
MPAPLALLVLVALAVSGCAEPAVPRPSPSSIGSRTAAATQTPRPAFPEVRGKVSIGQRALYVECRGDGPSTVLFHNGASSWHHEWDPVFDEIAAATRACRYDLPNTGDSDPVQAVRTAAEDVADIHALERAGVLGPPYVMVAFSAGSLPALLYAREHHDDVAAIVLVDPLLPGYEAAWQEQLAPDEREQRRRERAGENAIRYDFTTSEVQVGPAAGLAGIPITIIANDQHLRWEECSQGCEELTVTAQRLINEFAAAVGHVIVHRVASPHWVTGSHPALVRDSILSTLR